jgi:hypothetical protein
MLDLQSLVNHIIRNSIFGESSQNPPPLQTKNILASVPPQSQFLLIMSI